MLCAKRVGFIGPCLGESSDVEMSDTGKLALGFADRPAHGLDAGKSLRAGKLENLFKTEFGKDGGDESEFHNDGLFYKGVIQRCNRGIVPHADTIRDQPTRLMR